MNTSANRIAPQPRRPVLAIGAVALLIMGIIIAVLQPAWLTVPLQAAVENAGPAAPLVFVLLCALAAPLRLNGMLVAVSSVLWPLPVAGALSFTGSLLGCVLTAGLLSRWGGAALQERVAEGRWLQRLAVKVAQRPVTVGLLARIGIGSGIALEAFYLLAGYTQQQYLLVTTIGVAVWVAQALVGVTVLHALLQVSPWLALVGSIVPVLLAAGVFALRHRRRSSR